MNVIANHAVRAARPPGVAPELLRHVCDDGEVRRGGTAKLEGRPDTFGQPRAFEAMERALGALSDGYNVFATGPAGTEKRSMLADWLRKRADALAPPPDMVALHNFADPLQPWAVALPTGSAKDLAADVTRLVDDARHALSGAFESEGYRSRHRELHEEIDRRRNAVIEAVEQRAREAGVAIRFTPAGAITAPIVSGRLVKPDEAASLPDDVRGRYEAAVSDLAEPVEASFVTLHEIERDFKERHRELTRDVAVFAIGHLIKDVQRRWDHTPRLVEWLDGLREDAIDNLDQFRGEEEGEEQSSPLLLAALQQPGTGGYMARYVVNVLVAHDPAAGAPVIVATDPSFYDLFGRVEYETAFGAAMTDHRHLRAGLVHQASGGFLVLQAADLLTKPFVWQRLKEVVRTKQLKIENIAVQYMLFPGVTLDPEPADIGVTVVLVGPTQLYQLLHELDEDFPRLFKLRADFSDEMPRDKAGIRSYTELLAQLVREREMPDLDRGAIAALVEHGSRLAGHRDRLSTQVRALRDVAAEAGEIAASENAAVVGRAHVDAALRAQRRRSDLVEERIRDATLEGTVHIDVEGGVVGQVNGLAVALLGDHEFGHPVRITATVAPGEGEVLDIDREARLSGPVHAKGVLILSGYLAGRYFLDRPMTLRASIVFEQSYGPVEGDSASVAELLALLSALARLPVDQSIAVTGAVDQHGAVHAVGGINEKIEGFYDLCEARGLTGAQGVVIPETNLPHLMLDERVVAAVREGRFSVWPVRTVDQAVALVTGSETSDILVRERLLELSRATQAARRPQPGRNGGSSERTAPGS